MHIIGWRINAGIVQWGGSYPIGGVHGVVAQVLRVQDLREEGMVTRNSGVFNRYD